MDSFWTVLNGVTENIFLVGVYAILDYVLPYVTGPMTRMFPEGANFISMGISSADFVAKQVLFHFFGATQIRNFLSIK
jgi:hypothetical protein